MTKPKKAKKMYQVSGTYTVYFSIELEAFSEDEAVEELEDDPSRVLDCACAEDFSIDYVVEVKD